MRTLDFSNHCNLTSNRHRVYYSLFVDTCKCMQTHSTHNGSVLVSVLRKQTILLHTVFWVKLRLGKTLKYTHAVCFTP